MSKELSTANAALQAAQESGAIHYRAQLMKVSEFKKLRNLTVGNMHDITYANPDKLSIKAHSAKVARLTHKWVLFYEYQGTNKVICAGSLEEITGYIGKRKESRKSDLAILTSEY